MKSLSLIVLALVFSFGGCGGGATGIPQADACNQAAKAACAKIFGCPSLFLFQVGLQNQTMCEATIVTNCGSTGFQCSASQTYHPDKAQQCRDQFNNQTCDQIATNLAAAGINITAAVASLTVNIPMCGQICGTAGDAGGTPGP